MSNVVQSIIKSVSGSCAALFLVATGAWAEPTVFVNVNVIPMTSETVRSQQTVIVTDGRITSIGAVKTTPIPEDALVIDGTDRYLMPGLSEMHAHIPEPGTDSLERVLHLYVANGITLVRGMLGQPSHLQLRQDILDGSVLGPRLITSGPSFNGHSVQSPSQARQMVDKQYQAGYDFLKIHPGLSLEEFDAIAETAGKLGIPFAGHVPADVGIERALAAGIASIDHLDGYMQTLLPAHEDPSGGFEGFFGLLLANQAEPAKIAVIVAATRRANVWNVPTQSLFENVVSDAAASDMSAWPEMRYMPAVTVKQWVKSKNDVVTDDAYGPETATRAIYIRRQIIRALQDSGAGLLLGSDSPQTFNVPGFSIHRELQYLVDAGLTPYEALLTGTVNPARFFGRAGISGSVEIGYAADLVLLDANPLADISATRRVHGVMLRGRWVSKTDIKAMLVALQR
jgi:imidazolonepropionase-like amidohydrolase